MATIEFMEKLLYLAAEAESLVSGKNRSYERALKQELPKVVEAAELMQIPGIKTSRHFLWRCRLLRSCRD